MANHGYMKITGKAQGLISSGCSTQDSIGNKCQTAHKDEIMVLSYSHNMGNIGNANKPTHNPVIITKNVDKSSPLLAQALSSREEKLHYQLLPNIAVWPAGKVLHGRNQRRHGHRSDTRYAPCGFTE